MTWKCPECGEINHDDAIVKCLCGAELAGCSNTQDPILEAHSVGGYAHDIAHIAVDGGRGSDEQQQQMTLEFHGSAREYFRIWIVNLCLTFLTLGIFSAWAKVRKKRYFYSNVTLDGTPFQYLAQPLPILKGRIVAAALFMVYYASSHYFTSVLPFVLALGLVLAPWAIVRTAAFNARYSAYRNITFNFSGTYWDALKVIYAWGFVPALVIGTMFNWWDYPYLAGLLYLVFGLTFPWWIRRLKNFIVTKTSFGGIHGQFGATGGQFFKIYFVAGLIVLAIGFLNVIPIILFKNFQYFIILSSITIYIGYILAYAYIQANVTNTAWNQTRLGPIRFSCTLRGWHMAKLYLTNALAIIATAGLLIPWAVMRIIKYRVDNTYVSIEGKLSEFQSEESDSVRATGAELGDFFDMDLSL